MATYVKRASVTLMNSPWLEKRSANTSTCTVMDVRPTRVMREKNESKSPTFTGCLKMNCTGLEGLAQSAVSMRNRFGLNPMPFLLRNFGFCWIGTLMSRYSSTKGGTSEDRVKITFGTRHMASGLVYLLNPNWAFFPLITHWEANKEIRYYLNPPRFTLGLRITSDQLLILHRAFNP